MQRVSPFTWHRVPGYDSDAESEEQEQEDGSDEDGEAPEPEESSSDEEAAEESDDGEDAPGTKELLRQVIRALGEKWVDAPHIDMTPVQPGSKYASQAKLAQLASAAAQVAQASAGGPLPPAFRIERIQAPLVRETFLHNGFRPTRGEDWLISWSGPRIRDNTYKMMHEFQRVNHFPSSTELTRKDKLWENVTRMAKVMGKEDFDFVPETFVLPAEMKSFRQRYMKNKGEHLWIVKPTDSSQGKGIFILRNLMDLPVREAAVVSRYVENPLLIQGLKFDLRIYVLVTSFDPLRAFIYREGLTRFASKPYSTAQEHLSDVYRHLTNYSINKSAANFLENQRVQADNYGHKWSLSALNRHLKCVGVDVDVMWNGIMDLIVKTLLSVEPLICTATREACHHEQSCFELYGFDVLVDENLKSWLLEVNLSPSMQADSPLDKQIKSSLLSDAFNLLSLRKLDQQEATSARLRSRLMYLSKLQNAMPTTKRRHTAFGYRQDPIRRSQEEDMHGEAERAGDEEGEEKRPASSSKVRKSARRKKRFSTKRPVNLDELTESQLKLVAHALEELQRCNNFVPLYPTPASLKRYRPIAQMRGPSEDLRAQLLKAVLFAKQMPTCTGKRAQAGSALPAFAAEEKSDAESDEETRDGSEGEDGPNEEEDQPSAALSKVVPAAAHRDPKVAAETLQTLKVLGSKMGAQLLLMEYLVRVYNTCGKLSAPVRKKLESKEQITVANVLQSFRQQVALYLRTTSGARSKRMAAALAAALAEPDVPDGEGDIVDRLAGTSYGALVHVLCDTWGVSPEAAAMTAAVGSGEEELLLAGCAPAAFSQSASGCRAISALAGLSAADLESILKAPNCPLELRTLLDVSDSNVDPEACEEDLLRQRLKECCGAAVGPLSEMEFLLKVNAPRPLPVRRPPGPKEDLPPLAPRLVRHGFAYSAPQLHKHGRPGPLSPLGHRACTPSTNVASLGRGHAFSKALGPSSGLILPSGRKVKLGLGSAYPASNLHSEIEL